jgi:hypothetical protein
MERRERNSYFIGVELFARRNAMVSEVVSLRALGWRDLSAVFLRLGLGPDLGRAVPIWNT